MDSHILVPAEVLRRTPSREDGVGASVEAQLRVFGVELIQAATRLLRLPQIISVSAAAVFQRFYFRRSFAEFDVRLLAAASLLLACKLEEQHRRLRDVITVFQRLQFRTVQEGKARGYAGGPTPAVDSASRDAMKQEVIRAERHILFELGFAVYLLLEHPHKYVIQFVKSMIRSPHWLVAELAQKAWNYLNDSTRTVLCCQYRPHQIATASIYLAARALKIRLPADPPWWAVFETEQEDLKCIARTILRLYKRPPARYISVPRKCQPPLLGPPTPFTPFAETPLPLRSPSDDERPGSAIGGGSEGGATATEHDIGLDLDRINEMMREQAGGARLEPMAPGESSQVAAAAALEATARSRQERSRSPRRRVVQFTLPLGRAASRTKL